MPKTKSKSKSSKPQEDLNWSQYGLKHGEEGGTAGGAAQRPTTLGGTHGLDPHHHVDPHYYIQGSHGDELYRHEQDLAGHPWWMTNIFGPTPVLFGAWDGVFTSSIIHLFGVIIFLRAGWMVGNAGIGMSLVVVALSVGLCSISALAGIGICQRCGHLEGKGTVHFLLSHVLGAQLGGAISIVYCFGQAVSCALHAMGFAESMTSLLHIEDMWVQKAIAGCLILVLLSINVAGVKWVVRVQFILLIVLASAAVDFTIGTMYRTDPAHGVKGYNIETFESNFEPSYHAGTSLFTVFGVFFPAVTGVMAGINMSTDLANPMKDIPLGTFAAIGAASLLYFMFIMGLGSTCDRDVLLSDMMIAQKVSALGFFLAAGLYISSISHCLGSLYATPRIMQCIASENIIPCMRVLSRGRGPNKVPVFALVVFSLITLLFIGLGGVNVLAPIVTIPFLLTYASIEYAYFSLAMTFDIQRDREVRFLATTLSTSPSFQTDGKAVPQKDYGATKSSDLDRLFPGERTMHAQVDWAKTKHASSSSSGTSSPVSSPDDHSSIKSAEESTQTGDTATSPGGKSDMVWTDIREKPDVWFSFLENRWVALASALTKMAIMFLVQWGYALSAILVVAFCHFYIGQVAPGSFPGISEFRCFVWIRKIILRLIGKGGKEYEQIVVTGPGPSVQVTPAQLTAEGKDYASRGRYHQTSSIETRPKIGEDSD